MSKRKTKPSPSNSNTLDIYIDPKKYPYKAQATLNVVAKILKEEKDFHNVGVLLDRTRIFIISKQRAFYFTHDAKVKAFIKKINAGKDVDPVTIRINFDNKTIKLC